MKVNHNMTAVRTNLNLNRTNVNLDNATYRLSSGYKINAAKDDPAGYAILKRMNRQLKGLDQADSNAGDAISALNTADGALSEIHSILQRMNELSVQSANDSNTPEDRDKIQEEISQLMEEVDRIAETTDFNGRRILNGDSDRTSYVADSNGMRTAHTRILSQSSTVLPGDYEVTVTKDAEQATVSFALTAGTFSLNGEKVDISASELADGSAYEKVQTLCDRCNITLEQNGTNLTLTSLEYGKDIAIDVSIDGTQVAYDEGEDVVASFTTSDEGFSKSVVQSVNGNVVTFTDTNGFELKIYTEKGSAAEGTVTAKVEDASSVQVQIGSEATDMMEIVYDKISTETLGINYTNVRTYAGAQKAISNIQDAIDKVSSLRANLGAYTNRLGYAQDNLSTQTYNVESAVSRMGDTDMATEMTNYTELNVLEQATSTILSKANQRAETILQLLQS
jgi:flagellin